VREITQGRILQLIIQNNLAVTTSVVNAFKEIFDWKQKTPFFGAAVPKYTKWLRLQINQMYFTQLSQQSQLHTKASALRSLSECNVNWTKVPKSHTRAVDPQTVTLWQGQNSKTVTTGWTYQPLPTASQCSEKRRTQKRSRKPTTEVSQNLLQST
jgi:hypothetical protein